MAKILDSFDMGKATSPQWRERQARNVLEYEDGKHTPVSERASPIPKIVRCDGCGAPHRDNVHCSYCWE